MHSALAALVGRFPVPEPLGLFAGESLLKHPSGTWEALSFLPGHEIGYDDRPSPHDVGAFLAAFHQISAEVTSGYGARPSAAPLGCLHKIVDWTGAAATMGSTDGVELLRQLLDRFRADLERVRYAELATCVVHGDPTTFNVLADGDPPRSLTRCVSGPNAPQAGDCGSPWASSPERPRRRDARRSRPPGEPGVSGGLWPT